MCTLQKQIDVIKCHKIHLFNQLPKHISFIAFTVHNPHFVFASSSMLFAFCRYEKKGKKIYNKLINGSSIQLIDPVCVFVMFATRLLNVHVNIWVDPHDRVPIESSLLSLRLSVYFQFNY